MTTKIGLSSSGRQDSTRTLGSSIPTTGPATETDWPCVSKGVEPFNYLNLSAHGFLAMGMNTKT